MVGEGCSAACSHYSAFHLLHLYIASPVRGILRPLNEKLDFWQFSATSNISTSAHVNKRV